MALAYSYDGSNRVVDLSSKIMKIPNTWNLTEQLGLFTPEYKTQKRVGIQVETLNGGVIPDRNWDERNSVQKPRGRQEVQVAIPHFPLDDAITPNDLDGQISWDDVRNGISLETVSSVRARKMFDLRQKHARTLEFARMQLLRDGTVYAPEGTLKTSYGPTINWYTEMGVTQTSVEMDSLSDPLIDPMTEMEPIIAGIQDNLLSGDVVTGQIGLASPQFFAALTSHPAVREVYLDQDQNANRQAAALLTGRLTANVRGLDARYRTFDFGGILWIEVRGGDVNTAGVYTDYIPDNEARVFPVGDASMFRTYFAPANRFATINRTALPAYWFEYLGQKDDFIEIMSESNFMNAALRPQAIVRVYFTPA